MIQKKLLRCASLEDEKFESLKIIRLKLYCKEVTFRGRKGDRRYGLRAKKEKLP
jgi:hypothetical protein